MREFGLSKACLNAHTVILAKQHPNLVINCCSLGFINDGGCGATKPPEEGTVAIKHLLLGDVKGSGWYLGSGAQRSPQHYNDSGSHCEYRGQGEWLRSPRRPIRAGRSTCSQEDVLSSRLG